jgi:hypothetical protein
VPGKRVKAKNESLGSDSIRTDRALHAWRRERWLVSFHGARDRGKRRAVDFCECRHKYISWLRTVLDFAATNDDK